MNFVYDLNGSKGPNTVGKDIGFMSAFYSDKLLLVAPMPLYYDGGTDVVGDLTCETATGSNEEYEQCMNANSRYYGTIPTPEEAMSIKANQNLIGINLWSKPLLTNARGAQSYSCDYVLTWNDDTYAQELKCTDEASKFIGITTDGNAPKAGFRNPNGIKGDADPGEG